MRHVPSAVPDSAAPRPAPLRAASLEDALPGLWHGFTARLPDPGITPFADALRAGLTGHGADPRAPIYRLKQVHSPDLVVFPEHAGIRNASDPPPPTSDEPEPPRADGAILTHGAGAIAVQTADCVPILAVHRGRGEAAALHAGWRGAAAGILPRLLERWLAAGDSPAAIRLAFGPSIRACCYAVRQDCTGAFDPAHLRGAVTHREGRMYLELTRVLANQAMAHGLPADAIEILPHCTACHGEAARYPFASYRRDGRPGLPFRDRNASVIGFAAR